MDRDSIERWQAAKINKALHPKLNYLFRLKERMGKAGFPPGDPLLVLVEKAYDAMHRLLVEKHYLSCNGTGRETRE